MPELLVHQPVFIVLEPSKISSKPAAPQPEQSVVGPARPTTAFKHAADVRHEGRVP